MKLSPTSFTKRALIVSLIAGGGVLAASAFAVTADGPVSKSGCEAQHGQKHHGQDNANKWEEKRSEHMSKLKEKLKLMPEQEAAWDTFVGAAQTGIRPVKADRQAMRGEFEKLNTPQRLDKMFEMSELRRTKMVERSQAIKAFYGQLTAEQQSVFDAEAMPNRQQGHHQHRFQS